MTHFLKITLMVTLAMFLLVTACEPGSGNSSVDERQQAATEQLTAEAERQVGMPSITNFQERRQARMISELRDTADLTTYTYTVDMKGQRHFLCQSIGFGLPYSTQMTNPLRTEEESRTNGRFAMVTLPQPEPNGLFMPDNVDATWVMCLNPDTGDVSPVYSEPELLVSPFKLD